MMPSYVVHVGIFQKISAVLLFLRVLKVFSSNFKTGLPWELQYSDDLLLIVDSLKIGRSLGCGDIV